MSSQILLNQAVALHQAGNLAQAEPLYLQLLAADPRHFQTRYLFALLRYQQQRLPEALQAVDAALKLNPDAVEALMLQGVLRLALGRRPEALTSFTAVTVRKPGQLDAWYNLGVVLADLQRPEEAVAAFDRVLAMAPNADAWNNRGAALQSLKRFEEALRSFDKALALKPDFSGALYNRGTVLMELESYPQAVDAFDKVLAHAPNLAIAWNNRGAALQSLGRHAEALESYDRSLAIEPGYAAGWRNRASVLQSLKRPQEAVASYDKALAIEPGNAKHWNGRGDILLGTRHFEEALRSYDKALAIAPEEAENWNRGTAALQAMQDFQEAMRRSDKAIAIAPDDPVILFTRASLLCEVNRIAEGLDAYARRAKLVYGDKAVAGADDPPHKRRHDAEQRAYLAAQGGGGDDGLFHIEGGERLAERAVNPANAQDIAVQWRENRPQIVVIDNLLTPAALEKLRAFCWGSTIWRKAYKNGYLGAMPDSGFACPLLAQIAEELRETFPTIFCEYGLNMLWGFKYDSSLGGIRIHADQAAVNVNFWITPDEANRNPQTGGLVIWDASAPLDWEITKYNGDDDAVRAFLAGAKSKPMTVAYRANRAVIFDSDLFHETDRIDFEDGYENRRINITMLYGRRTFHGH